MILGVFPLTIMFLITSIATLRERRTGTLDRLMTMPISKLDFVLGYAIAFALVATVQTALATWVVTGLLKVPIAGGGFAMLLGAVAAALLGTTFGLFVSAFAATEFQAVQFMPVFLFPQILTCGLLVARDHMATWLQTISDYLPMTYSVDAMKRITHETAWSADLTRDFMIVLMCAFGVLVLGAITIRRQD
jgi:ABC-2 type transport system permease protein